MSDKKLIIFTDSGDTIINEGTEVREVAEGVVYNADCIEEAKETMLNLYDEGYTIALVADGLVESFDNVLEQNGLNHIFTKRAISESVGVEKPAALMFETAMKELGLEEKDKKRIVMIGNNLKRDILGANKFGITSILLEWSPRYNMIPETEEETPDYTVSMPSELLPLLKKLNDTL